jgi:hypothetical protein
LQYSSTDCLNQHPIRKYGTCMRERMPTKWNEVFSMKCIRKPVKYFRLKDTSEDVCSRFHYSIKIFCKMQQSVMCISMYVCMLVCLSVSVCMKIECSLITYETGTMFQLYWNIYTASKKLDDNINTAVWQICYNKEGLLTPRYCGKLRHVRYSLNGTDTNGNKLHFEMHQQALLFPCFTLFCHHLSSAGNSWCNMIDINVQAMIII